ncbi:unnamed protein product, partial [Chrysoparadoxa australica]
MGEHVQEVRVPRVVKGLLNKSVKGIASGRGHVVCVTLRGEVYSWGNGGDGRLGHGNHEDCFHPRKVEALEDEVVTHVACGVAHTAAVTLHSVTEALPNKVYCWGRGAHGRLGTGDAHSRNTPVKIHFPPSFKSYTVKACALGGAHSVLLAQRDVPETRGNPWGRESQVYSWGFGFNGQLGLGKWEKEVHTPARVFFEKWVVIESIAAGKCHTLACSQDGDLYAWGKGWYGALGLGKDKDFRVA